MSKILLLFILLIGFTGFSQDPQFSQFYANPIYLNPALAGSEFGPRISMNSRNEWPGSSAGYLTNSVSYDQYVRKLHGSFAVMFTNDMSDRNAINWSALSLVYAYQLNITRRWRLSFAGQFTWNQKYINLNKLTYPVQLLSYRGFLYEPNSFENLVADEGKPYASGGVFDVSAGALAFSEYLYAGFTAKHLNTPREPENIGGGELSMMISGQAGAKIPLWPKSEKLAEASISPNLVYYRNNGFSQVNLGAYISYGWFTLGAWYRTRDALILTAGIDWRFLRLGYSYDHTVSPLTNAAGGSHELSMALHFRKKPNMTAFRGPGCPAF